MDSGDEGIDIEMDPEMENIVVYVMRSLIVLKAYIRTNIGFYCDENIACECYRCIYNRFIDMFNNGNIHELHIDIRNFMENKYVNSA